MSKYIKLLTLFIFCSGFIIKVSAQENTLYRNLEITERYFEDGDYKKALEEAEKLYKKYQRKDEGYLATAIEPYLIKYYEATGDFVGMRIAVESLLKHRKLQGEQSIGYGLALLGAAKVFAENTYTQQAETYLEEAKKILGKKPEQSFILARMLEAENMIYLYHGRFKELLDENRITNLLDARNALIGKTTTYYSDFEKQIKDRDLSERERIRKKVDYAEILTMKADVSRLAGRYKDAKTYLEQADEWIKKELSTRNTAYIRNQTVRIELMIDNGEEREEIRTLLEKTLYRAERTFGTVHKDYLKLHQLLIGYYLHSGFVAKSMDESSFSLMPSFLQNARYGSKNTRQRWELTQNAGKYYGTDRMQYSLALQSDALWHYENQRYEQSIRVFSALYKDTNLIPKNHERRLEILKDAYYVRLAADDYQEAGKLLEEWVNAQERIHGTNTLGYHLAKLQLAKYYMNYTEKFQEAGELYNLHMPKLTDFVEENSLIYINALNDWLGYYIANEEFDVANGISNQVLDLIKARYGDSHPRYAAQLEIAISLNMIQSKYKEVDSQVVQMLIIYENQYNPSLAFEHAQALETAAHYYMIMGLYERAEELLNQAERRFNRSSQSIANSTSAEELAFLYIETANFRAANEILKATIEEKERRYGKESRFLITTYNQAARLEFANGNYLKAEDYATKALAIAQTIFGEEALRTVESQSILADYHLAIGDFEKAEELATKALAIKTKVLGENHLDRATTLIQVAQIKFYEGKNWNDVINLLDEADKVIIENLGKNTPVYAGFLKTSAKLYVAHKDTQKASDKLSMALNTLEKIPSASAISIAEINVLLGDLEVQQNNIKRAGNFYTTARKTYLKSFSHNHPKYIELLGKIARMHYVANDYKKSEKYIQETIDKHKEYLNTVFPLLSEREKAKNWEQIRPDFEFFTFLAIKLQPKKKQLLEELYDNTLLTKGILLNQSQKLRNDILNRSPEDSLRKNFEKWQLKQLELQDALALNSEQLKEQNIDIKTLQREVDNLSKILSKQSSEFAQAEQTEMITWKEIQKALKKDEFAVEIIRYREFENDFTDSINYVALIMPSSGKLSYTLFENGNNMEFSELQYYRNTVEFGIEDYSSYKTYWKPIADKIGDNSKRIYLSCDGVYNQLNVETFRIDETNFVIDKFFVAQVTNTKEITETNSAKNAFPSNFALFGNPKFYLNEQSVQSYLPLPGAEEEIKAIAHQLEEKHKNVNTYLNEDAKEDVIKSLHLPSSSVLHLATHGVFIADISESERERSALLGTYNDPLMRSGLLLTGGGDLAQSGNVHEFNKSDGVLTASEVANLNLPYPLIILSACETGRGDTKVGEGVYGLQRAILVAGADALLMSLFKVDDEATKQLMEIFYQKWFELGDKRAAMRQAKIELRKNENFQDPIYWGAFVMVGK